MRNRIFGALIALALGVGLGTAIIPALAQNTDSIGDELGATISTSTSASTALIAGVTGKRLVLKGLLLNADTAGVYILTDGDGGTTKLNIYLAQNADRLIDDKLLSDVFKTTAGNGWYIDGPTSSACRAVVRYRRQ